MGLRLFFLPNFPGATFIQRATFIPDFRAAEAETMITTLKSLDKTDHLDKMTAFFTQGHCE